MSASFLILILSLEKFWSVYNLSQYIEYQKNFQNIHTFAYQRALLQTLFACY